MTNKEKYREFCQKTYIPIYSKPWWLDVVCGSDKWDVWIYQKGGQISAAMPYYIDRRDPYTYITKALLSQNNGIIFHYPLGAKAIAKLAFEERVIDEACKYIESLNVDVYEQQYSYSFTNWLPFFWNGYTAMVRYTYVLENMCDIQEVWGRISALYRSTIKKGQRNIRRIEEIDYKEFYKEHEKIFLKQGLQCPFSLEKWEELYKVCVNYRCGKILAAKTYEGKIASVIFLIWDEQSVYQLLMH